ncbi:MAG TPA: thiamine phosphate synthase [Candidatus Binatia bacterium]
MKTKRDATGVPVRLPQCPPEPLCSSHEGNSCHSIGPGYRLRVPIFEIGQCLATVCSYRASQKNENTIKVSLALHTTHDLARAREAVAGDADYIGFGPILGSTTKDTGYSPRGLEMLREIRGSVNLPIVAIGGITEGNVAEVWKAGADAAAIISDLMRAEDVVAKIKRIFNLLAVKSL